MKCSSVALLVALCVASTGDAATLRAPRSPLRSVESQAPRKSSIGELLQLLADEKGKVGEPPPLETSINVVNASKNATISTGPPFDLWLVKCLAHTKKVIRDIDISHTDMQIAQTVEQECWLELEFPKTSNDGFKTKESCHDFAARLACAREEELNTGSKHGYEAFCRDYYAHKYPAKNQALAVGPSILERPSLIPGKLLIVLALAAVLACVALVAGRSQQ